MSLVEHQLAQPRHVAWTQAQAAAGRDYVAVGILGPRDIRDTERVEQEFLRKIFKRSASGLADDRAEEFRTAGIIVPPRPWRRNDRLFQREAIAVGRPNHPNFAVQRIGVGAVFVPFKPCRHR